MDRMREKVIEWARFLTIARHDRGKMRSESLHKFWSPLTRPEASSDRTVIDHVGDSAGPHVWVE